jgi:cell division protein FtsA
MFILNHKLKCFKRHLEYHFCDNGGIIIDEKNVAKELVNLIKDANRQL